MLVSIVVTTLVVVLIFRAMVRGLGWPTSADAAARWCVSLLVLAVVASSLPAALRSFAGALPPLPELPPVAGADLLVALFLLGLLAAGYIASQEGAARARYEEERDARARDLPRVRATPPPPGVQTIGQAPASGRDGQAGGEGRVEHGRVIFGERRR